MAKVVEEVKAYRNNVQGGDLVTWKNADGIYLVNSVKPSGTDTSHCTIVKLASGEIFDDIHIHTLRLYHGTVKLSNE